MTEAYPLQWPVGRPRTKRPERSRFNVSFADARDSLFNELRLMGARLPVLSTNISLRRDGLPYANQPEPEDRGIAVYFEWKGRQMAFGCDRWDRTRDNVQAVRHTIAALRGLDRWGTGDMVESAFTGFEALPPPEQWWNVLECAPDSPAEAVHSAFKEKALSTHPDRGGSTEAFQRVQRAYAQSKEMHA